MEFIIISNIPSIVPTSFTNNLSLMETLLSSFFVLLGLLPSVSCLMRFVKVIIV